MNYKINNTLFERKHHYVTILKESELLKQQMNEEVLDGTISATRLDEINHICTLAFAGLLQEGLEFRYSRDTNISKESLIMTIDHIDYRCKVNALRGILRDKLDDYLNGTVQKEEMIAPEPVTKAEDVERPFISPREKADVSMGEPASTPADTFPERRRSRFSFGVEEDTNSGMSFDEKLRISHKEQMPGEQHVLENTASDFNVHESEEDEEFENEAPNGIENMLLASLLKNLSADSSFLEDEEEDENVETVPASEEAPLPSEMENAASVTTADVATEGQSPLPESVKEELDDEWYVEMEEKEKHKNTFCYEIHRIMVTRGGTKNTENAFGEQTTVAPANGEEIFFMIAPTRIERSAMGAPSVPVVVYAYYNGKTYYSGSFKNGNPDKNLLRMQIGDYDFLIRGMFKDRKFESHIFPAGDSYTEDIVLHSIEQKTYNPEPAKVRNGHLRFQYEGADEATGTVEVYPINEGDNTFIVMHKIEHPTKGVFESQYCTEENKKILLHTKEGTRELICWWDGDIVKADAVPS